MSTMVLQHGPAPLPYPEPPFGAAPGWQPPANPPPPPTPRRRWVLPVTAATAALLIGAGIGIVAGRETSTTTAPEPVTTTVEAAPQPQPFTNADSAWCREYQATSDRLAEAGRASGAPRNFAAKDLPAAAWTPEESAANARFATYLATWGPGLADLRASASNPTLKSLIEGSSATTALLVDRIQSGQYVPADANLDQSSFAMDSALLAICKEIT